MYRNMVTSLVINERIITTLAKAKEIRRHADRVILKGVNNDIQSRRIVKSYLFTKEAYEKVVNVLAPRFSEVFEQDGEIKFGATTRITYIGTRQNDSAKMAMIEYLDNPMEIQKENQYMEEKAESGLPSFWEWEKTILQQEEQFFSHELQKINSKLEGSESMGVFEDDQTVLLEDIDDEVDDQVEFEEQTINLDDAPQETVDSSPSFDPLDHMDAIFPKSSISKSVLVGNFKAPLQRPEFDNGQFAMAEESKLLRNKAQLTRQIKRNKRDQFVMELLKDSKKYEKLDRFYTL